MAEEIALLVGLRLTSRARKPESDNITADESMEELVALAQSAGATVAETSIQARPKPDAATLVGSGKLDQLKAQAQFHEATTVIFDRDGHERARLSGGADWSTPQAQKVMDAVLAASS